MSKSGYGSRVAIFSAADCLPRLSPPAASPASSAASRCSASDPRAASNAASVRATTAGPASMLPATETSSPRTEPHQLTHASPVCAAIRPPASRMWICRCARPASAASSAATTESGASPARSRGIPCTAYIGLISAWVASAPTPPSTWIARAPTAKNRVATAAPNAPVAGSRARMDHVMAAS